MTVTILQGDCRETLKTLADESVNCVVTSPPYWGLRDYGNGDAGIGLESSVQEHIDALVGVFRDVHRVLRVDGTLWLNYGDAYAGSWGAQSRGVAPGAASSLSGGQVHAATKARETGSLKRTPGIKAKDLIGLPWRLAFALQADGWWLRSDIIWAKPNPMPESVTDRPTRAHEYVFLLSKSARYAYDADAIRTQFSPETKQLSYDTADFKRRDKYKAKMPGGWDRGEGTHGTIHRDGRASPEYQEIEAKGANARTVWTIATEAFPEAHFATFPTELARRCILAGCPEGGTVLDCFAGAGTVGLVADRLKRSAILLELNPDYCEMARRRIAADAPLFAEVTG